MKYRVILCGGLLATAILLSSPNSSSALPAAPSALLPADRMFVVGAYVARPRYATSEGCVG